MNRILVLFAAAMVLAAPAFAAGSASQSATTVYKGNTPKGKSEQSVMQGNVNQTQVKNSDMINVGRDNTIKIGTQSNSGGKMTGNVNQTQVTGSKIVNVGQGNATEIGTQSNN